MKTDIHRVLERGNKIHPTIIKQVLEKIKFNPNKHIFNKRYQENIEHGGSKYFVVFEFLEDEIFNQILDLREIKIVK